MGLRLDRNRYARRAMGLRERRAHRDRSVADLSLQRASPAADQLQQHRGRAQSDTGGLCKGRCDVVIREFTQRAIELTEPPSSLGPPLRVVQASDETDLTAR